MLMNILSPLFLMIFSQRDELNTLNVIHITGTKGKGSTSAFTSSILCHVKPEWKIGVTESREYEPYFFLILVDRIIYLPPHGFRSRAYTN